MLETLALWLLLPLGIALGIALGRNPRGALPDSEMLAGLTLAQDNPDRAIAALTKAIERDPAAAELNLTLGALFRKRGEIDRALRLHESVLSHNELKPDTRALALYELGLDCLKAGLLDRAEETLRRSAQHPSFEVLAYEQLLPLHEQLGDWQQAAAIAERLEALKGQSYATARAHHMLEQAEESRQAGDAVQAIRLAKRALEIDPSCVRANLLLGSLQEQAQDWVAALEALSRIAAQDARYLPEAIRAAKHVSQSSGELERFRQFLDGLLPQHEQATDVWLALAECIESEQERALYVAHKLAEKPNWRGLVTFLGLAPVRQAGVMSQPVDAFRKALQQAAERRAPYLCRHCGFAPSLLFWRCPSCKQWGTVAPSEENL